MKKILKQYLIIISGHFSKNREICKAIRNKYYLNTNESMYFNFILLFKFNEVLIDDEESDAETEEDYEDEEDN